MKIVFWGKGNRGINCLQSLCDSGYRPDLIVAEPQKEKPWYGSILELARNLKLKSIDPLDPNQEDVQAKLKEIQPDLFILAGYGKILKKDTMDIPRIMSINLHAGKLPKYRGSSPLNWALINGERSFTLSIIKVDTGVDTGDILLERTFEIKSNDTIADLHNIANRQFPEMLIEVIRNIEKENDKGVRQDPLKGSYYPLRFPEDGLILWDVFTAEQIHNRIRALTDPYPGAFTYFGDKKVKLLASELAEFDHYGEPGRVYKKNEQGLLICAVDKCLWIKKAVYDADKRDIQETVNRYDKLVTIRDFLLDFYIKRGIV